MCDMYTCPVNYNIDGNKMWDSQDSIEEDKVILETEITLKTGPNITMKIHEESRHLSGTLSRFDSEEDTKDPAILRVFEDDESDFDENRQTPRSPRKVRFGGESVKLRTPESESSQQEEDNEISMIKITVTDAVSIRTKRSLIPVRVSSLPSTPKKKLNDQKTVGKHYKSAPNLTMASSKIPLRKKVMQDVQTQADLKITNGGGLDNGETMEQQQPKSVQEKQEKKERKEVVLRPSILKHSRADDSLSPIPVHNEIEVFHNLTRSPERSRRNSETSATEKDDENSQKVETTLINQDQIMETKPMESADFRNYDSFTIYEESVSYVTSQTNLEHMVVEEVVKRQSVAIPGNSNELTIQQSLSSLTSDDEVWAKSEALESLIKMLKQPGTCETLEAGAAALLFEALFACHHRDRLHSLADDALVIMIEDLRPDVLEKCLSRLTLILCKMGGASGAKCALAVMKKLPPKRLQVEVLSKCFGHRTREGALQILMLCARLFPRQDVEVPKVTEFASMALRDRRRRVRHAALETLATAAQLTTIHEVLNIVETTVKNFLDFEEVMQVVHSRLSRKQLPTVNLDGTIRYSSPIDQTESEWIAGTIVKNLNVSSSPLSSASSSNASVNYWMHNLRHDQQFNAGSTLIKQLSESYEEDPFEDASREWASTDSNNFQKNNNSVKGSNHGVLRPVYILQPEMAPLTNGKHGRQYRRYDRGRSFSPPKYFRGQYPPQGYVEAIPLHPEYNTCSGNNGSEFNGRDNHSDNSDAGGRLQHPELEGDRPKTGRPHGFRKSFSSDQLYFNDRLPAKQEPYSFSLSSRSSSTSTGSSTRSGFWHKSAIPVPIIEPKLKLRHSNTSIVSTSGPLIAKRSVAASVHQTPTSSKSSPRHQPAQENDSITRLTLPTPRSSGSESSGYFTPSPPESHPPAFIKMDTEERLSSDIEEPLSPSVNNSRDCIDSHSLKSVSDSSSKREEPKANSNSRGGSASQNHFLGEAIHDKYPSVESIHLNNNQELSEQRPFSRISLGDSNPTIEISRKSKSVIDLPNFLPRIGSHRLSSNSAPAKNEENTFNNNETPSQPYQHTDDTPVIEMPQTHADHQIVASTSVTITKSKLERRFSRNNSRKSMKATPRNHQEVHTSRPISKPKDLLQHALNELDNPNWETTVSGLQGLARVARQTPEVIEHQMHQVCFSLAKHIKNLRSQVARVACNTAGDLFLHCKHGLDMELDEIACPLLQRTADTNRFLRADANAALDIMCEQLPIHRVIPVITLRGCGHQNAVVRATAVRILGDIVRRLGPERTLALPKELRDRLLLSAANSLADGNLDTRSQGKSLFKCLIGQPQFHKHLHEAVPQNILRHISKILLSIKPDSS